MRPSATIPITTEIANTGPEFLRTEAVRSLFGIKRGTLYNLFKQNLVKGALLRQRGNITGVRVWDANSIRNYIHSQMLQPSIQDAA